MWIRSQDKETLTNVKHLSIRYLNGYYGVFTDNHLAPNEICNLAIYKTKEKAIQILDEIQDQINNNYGDFSYDGYGNNHFAGSIYTIYNEVYQMPQDDEVNNE